MGVGGLFVTPSCEIVGPLGGSMSVIVEGFALSQSLSASETSTVTFGKPENPCASTIVGPWDVEPCRGAASGTRRAPSNGLLLAGKFCPAAALRSHEPGGGGRGAVVDGCGVKVVLYERREL